MGRIFNIEEFEGYLKIDKSNLDEEIIRQPSLFFEVSKAYSKAVAQADTKKDKLKQLESKLDALKRKKLMKTEGKVTEAMVFHAIQIDEKRVAAYEEYIKAKEIADTLDGFKEAFRQRTFMLRELAGLYVAQYYDKDSVGGKTAEFQYERRKEQMRDKRKERAGGQ